MMITRVKQWCLGGFWNVCTPCYKCGGGKGMESAAKKTGQDIK